MNGNKVLKHVINKNMNFSVMSPIKIPPLGKKNGARFRCPITGCSWSCKERTSYYRHHDTKHAVSFRFICRRCGAGQSRPELAEEHADKCKGSRAANLGRRGRKPKFATDRQIRVFHPADEEEELQEMEESLEGMKRENQQLLADKNQLQVEKEQLRQKYEDEKRAKDELREYVGKLEARLNQMEAQESSMDVERQPELEEQLQDDNDFELALSEEDDEVEENDEVLEEVPVIHHVPLLPQIEIPVPPLMKPRRSGRIPGKEKEKTKLEMVLNTSDPGNLGLLVKDTTNMGRGVFADRGIAAGEWVVEYSGEILGEEEARRRQEEVGDTGYIFWHKDAAGKWLCVDATAETGHPGRLINHAKKKFNLVAKKVPGLQRLVLKSIRQIEKGEQLLFDYNEDRREVIDANIWMK